MQRSLEDLESSPGKSAVSRAVNVGIAANILRFAPVPYHFSYLDRVLEPALRHRSIKFYFNSRGDEVGFAVWALLAPGVEDQFTRNRQWDLHISEWNEGDNLWMIDLVAPHGHLRKIIDDLDGIFEKFRTVSYCRVKRGKTLQKTWARVGRNRFRLVQSGDKSHVCAG
jgi:hemolysin-activating ACP:hemolysin acyltransferase